MQHRPAFSALPHLRDPLSHLNTVAFLDQQLSIMTVGAEIGLVVFDDHELTVSVQTATAIDHFTRRGRANRLTQTSNDIQTLAGRIRIGVRPREGSVRWPKPLNVLLDMRLWFGLVLVVIGPTARKFNGANGGFLHRRLGRLNLFGAGTSITIR